MEQGTPSITYRGVENLRQAIENTSGDGLRVEGVTPTAFAQIFAARAESDKYRLFFSEAHGVAIVTIPTRSHERASSQLAKSTMAAVMDMGLWKQIVSDRAATFRPPAGHPFAGSGEGDETITPILPNGRSRAWPSVVLEVGCSQSMADLKMKAEWWFGTSDYAVKVVILVRLRQSQGSVTLEKWTAAVGNRPGATTTRRSASNARQPACVQTIVISRSDTYDHTAAARLDPNSYVVARGPLRLGFAELFDREPRAGEYDIVIEEEDLREMAALVWEYRV